MRLFDNIKHDTRQISFLLHSDAVDQMSQSEQKILSWLLEFGDQKFIDIKITPTKIEKTIQHLESKGFLIPKYIVENEKLAIESKRDSPKHHFGHLIMSNPPEEKNLSKNSNLTNYDMYYFNSESFDFFIVGEPDTSLNDPRRSNLVVIDVAFEYLRLLLLKNGDLHTSPVMTFDRHLYYLYRHARIFSNFQRIWSIAISSNNSIFLRALQSVNNRLTFIIKSIDIIDYTLLSTPTIDSKADFKYHFGYLCVLLTGLLDDFAWIFAEQNTPPFSDHPQAIGLRVKHNKQKSNFSKAIRSSQNDLADLIESDSTKEIINIIYSIRDKVQHQKYIETQQTESFMISMPKTNLDEVNLQSLLKAGVIMVEHGSTTPEYFLSPESFIVLIKKNYYEIVRKLIGFINVGPYVNQIDQEKMMEIENGYNLFLNAPWEFFKFCGVPTLLEFAHV